MSTHVSPHSSFEHVKHGTHVSPHLRPAIIVTKKKSSLGFVGPGTRNVDTRFPALGFGTAGARDDGAGLAAFILGARCARDTPTYGDARNTPQKGGKAQTYARPHLPALKPQLVLNPDPQQHHLLVHCPQSYSQQLSTHCSHSQAQQLLVHWFCPQSQKQKLAVH